MRVAVIVNPAARKGGARARWPAIQAELAKRLGPVEPLFTGAPDTRPNSPAMPWPKAYAASWPWAAMARSMRP